MRLRVAVGSVALALTVALTAGCGAAAPPAPAAAVTDNPDCLAPQVLSDLGLVLDARIGTPHADAPDSGRMPDDFHPVSVLRCSVGGTLLDGAGIWGAVSQTRLEGDLDPLLDALTLPSLRRADDCPRGTAALPGLWLVDALGRAVRPTVPTGECGAMRTEVATALAGLRETDQADYPVQLISKANPAKGE